jgi:hypothetical protein
MDKTWPFPPIHDPAYGLSAEALEFARQRYEKTEDSQQVARMSQRVARMRAR